MPVSPTASPAVWLSVLRESHDRLAALVDPMDDATVESPSYDDDWTIAQVLSHLGSGAEIFALFLEAALDGADAPGVEAFQPVWETWNAKRPHDQAHDAIRADAAFLDRIEALSDEQREAWRLDMFGSEQRLADVLRLRLGEHAVHSWDIAVMLDPTATVMADAVDLVVDHLDQLVARASKPPAEPVDVLVRTEAPSRTYRLRSADGSGSLTSEDEADPAGAATLRLPAEAWLRLVYGRLDPDHTPPLETDGIDLDTLRQMFPGV